MRLRKIINADVCRSRRRLRRPVKADKADEDDEEWIAKVDEEDTPTIPRAKVTKKIIWGVGHDSHACEVVGGTSHCRFVDGCCRQDCFNGGGQRNVIFVQSVRYLSFFCPEK